MIEIRIHPELDPWFGVCYRFDSGDKARAAWTALNEVAPADGDWHIGAYRHQRIGLDKEPVLVSVVGDKVEGFVSADAFLVEQGGEETELHIETWLQLVRRRIEKIIELHGDGAGYGRFMIPHPPEGDRLC